MNRKMSDAELSRRLGAYQAIERIGMIIGLILVAAGGVIAIVQHNLWIFAGLFFAGVIVLVIISFVVNTKKNVLLNLQLGDFFHSELQSAFGPGTAEPAMLISEKYLKDAELIDQCWEGSDISNFFEGEHAATRFSVANVTLDHLVEERSGPDNDNWMTKTVTVFKGVILRCADMCDANLDLSITDRYQESPPKGDVSDPAVFAERFKVRTFDGREAAALVTPEMRTLCSELEKAVDGKLCGLKLKDGEAAAALHTKYQFANVPPNTDLRNIDGIRKAYVESIEAIITLLDILKNNL